MDTYQEPKKHEVTVDEETYIVWAVKSGKSTWTAYGDFRGRYIRKTGGSESSAISSWKHIANHRANE
jgi:hypothetical protein